MLDWFRNPGFLAVAAAAISVPIIIHLINRMRFKRIRWAAMEFLLKAQKRNRRRLIIEQLLLLALRCLLVALTGFLVMRFVGFSFSDFASKQALHVVLVDDTLSMSDTWKTSKGETRTSFDVAKEDIIENKIVRALEKANAGDQLLLMPVSKVHDPEYVPKVYSRLNTGDKVTEFKNDLKELKPTALHVSLQDAVKRVKKLIDQEEGARVTLHVVSDFRQRDWAQSEAQGLHQMLQSMAKSSRDFKARLIDVGYPAWEKGRPDPGCQDNVGIIDFRAGTRVAGKGMPVGFTATVANFSGRVAEVRLVVYDKSGSERQEVNFTPMMPMKLSPGSTATVAFEMRFQPNIKAGEPHFEQIALRLKSPAMGELENDGLAADNSRFAVVEIRERVPILVIDGEGAKSRDVARQGDSFFVQLALTSATGASYELFWGDELGGGVAAKALERPDLAKFPSIFMLNVRELNPKQLANLEAYVQAGGAVCFFLGPQVSPKFYTEKLYKGGDGLFPVPLADTYYPPPSDEPRNVKFNDQPQLLLREEQYGGGQLPIFGELLKEPKQRNTLKDLPIHRYFKVARSKMKGEGRLLEIASLPNETSISDYHVAVKALLDQLGDVLRNDELAEYRKVATRYQKTLKSMTEPGSELPAYNLATVIDQMFAEKGDDKKQEGNLLQFWALPDRKVGAVKTAFLQFRDQVRFGDPLIVTKTFGKGRVVATLTTAGPEWNNWPNSFANLIYPTFFLEMQSYVTQQSAEDDGLVGAVDQIVVDGDAYRGKQLKAKRVFFKGDAGKTGEPPAPKEVDDRFGEIVKGQFVFTFPKNEMPGLYVTTVREEGHSPVATFGRSFNVDTAREGPLERVNRGEIESNVIGDYKDQISFEGPTVNEDSLVTRMSDSSESTWLFLLFLFVLVVEQALAVHLSFHLKGSENEVLARVTRGS